MAPGSPHKLGLQATLHNCTLVQYRGVVDRRLFWDAPSLPRRSHLFPELILVLGRRDVTEPLVLYFRRFYTSSPKCRASADRVSPSRRQHRDPAQHAPKEPACQASLRQEEPVGPGALVRVVCFRTRNEATKNGSIPLDFDPFDLVEREFLPRSVVKLGRPGRFVIGDGLGVLKCAAVLEVSGDPGSSERVTAGGIGQGGRLGPPLD